MPTSASPSCTLPRRAHGKGVVDPPASRSGRPPGPRPRITILHADDDLTIIDKPSGITSVSERWDPEAPTAIDLLWSEWKKREPDPPRPHVVHRLDKDTSGVIAFARHRDAQASLREQFRDRTVEKTYRALTAGIPNPHEGTIEIEIEPDPSKPGRVRLFSQGGPSKRGKECFTEYTTLQVFGWFAWVELHPKTGRTHQLRISLREVSAPIVADPFYGDGASLFLSKIKRDYHPGRGKEERPLLGRLGLHAAALTFDHPTTGERTTVEAPLPKDLRTTLRQLERWS